MGLAVKGSSYITEIKMLQSNPGELQRDFMFKRKTVELSKITWILFHKDLSLCTVLSEPETPRNPPKNMSSQVMLVLSPALQGKEHLQQPVFF